MANWLMVAIWIIWSFWTLVEVLGFMGAVAHNRNRVKVVMLGPARYTRMSKAVTWIYLILTVLWFSYNFA